MLVRTDQVDSPFHIVAQSITAKLNAAVSVIQSISGLWQRHISCFTQVTFGIYFDTRRRGLTTTMRPMVQRSLLACTGHVQVTYACNNDERCNNTVDSTKVQFHTCVFSTALPVANSCTRIRHQSILSSYCCFWNSTPKRPEPEPLPNLQTIASAQLPTFLPSPLVSTTSPLASLVSNPCLLTYVLTVMCAVVSGIVVGTQCQPVQPLISGIYSFVNAMKNMKLRVEQL